MNDGCSASIRTTDGDVFCTWYTSSDEKDCNGLNVREIQNRASKPHCFGEQTMANTTDPRFSPAPVLLSRCTPVVVAE